MIFRLSDKEFFKDNPEAKSIKQFLDLGDQGMKYMCLVYGYNSPLRKMEMIDRKHKAVANCGFKPTPKGRPSKLQTDLMEMRSSIVKKAYTEYMELQFDADRDLLSAYDEQINEFKCLMRNREKSDKQLDQALKIAEKLPKLLETRKQIQDILEVRDVEEFAIDEALSEFEDDQSMVEEFLNREDV